MIYYSRRGRLQADPRERDRRGRASGAFPARPPEAPIEVAEVHHLFPPDRKTTPLNAGPHTPRNAGRRRGGDRVPHQRSRSGRCARYVRRGCPGRARCNAGGHHAERLRDHRLRPGRQGRMCGGELLLRLPHGVSDERMPAQESKVGSAFTSVGGVGRGYGGHEAILQSFTVLPPARHSVRWGCRLARSWRMRTWRARSGCA